MKTIRRLLPKLPAALLLIGAVVLMQKHAWEFWSQYDATFGPLWAVMLEGAALWLWSQRSIAKNALALVASLLVLAGPLYQVSAPAIQQYQQSTTAPALYAKREQQLLADQQRLTDSLARYNANSETRAGWLGAITGTQAELTAVNDQLTALYAEQAQAQPMTWQALAVIAMQATALLIFQLLIVLCIRAITEPAAARTTNVASKPEPFTAKKSANAQRLKAAA